MKNILTLTKIDNISIIKTGLIAAAVVVMALPAMASAASYAYIDQGGYVRSITADSAAQAMMMGPNIDENSGVLLMNDASDFALVGRHVPGA